MDRRGNKMFKQKHKKKTGKTGFEPITAGFEDQRSTD